MNMTNHNPYTMNSWLVFLFAGGNTLAFIGFCVAIVFTFLGYEWAPPTMGGLIIVYFVTLLGLKTTDELSDTPHVIVEPIMDHEPIMTDEGFDETVV